MEKKTQLVPLVKSPAKDSHLRAGKGFSLKEIKSSGISINLLKKLNIKIDYFRKTIHPENIEKLNSIKEKKAKKEKKPPFVKKEKKKTPFKPKVEKPKIKPSEVIKELPKEIKVITKGIPSKAIKEEVKIQGTPLTELSGLGATTEKKFIELGVNCIEELIKEDPKEIAQLIKGVSLKRVKSWIEEGKTLIE